MASFSVESTTLAESMVCQIKQAVKEYNKTLKPKVKTGYERFGQVFYISGNGEIRTDLNPNNPFSDRFDKRFDDGANLYSDLTVAKSNARADKLMRQLRRFAVEENAKSGIMIDWKDYTQDKYYVYYDYYNNRISFSWRSGTKHFTQAFFTTKKIAQTAIEKLEDELTWYFTEYKDYYIEDDEIED